MRSRHIPSPDESPAPLAYERPCQLCGHPFTKDNAHNIDTEMPSSRLCLVTRGILDRIFTTVEETVEKACPDFHDRGGSSMEPVYVFDRETFQYFVPAPPQTCPACGYSRYLGTHLLPDLDNNTVTCHVSFYVQNPKPLGVISSEDC